MDLQTLEGPPLEKIIDYCDHSSKLNLMLVNKYFYNFIGKNSRLCEYCFDSIFWAGFTDWLAKLGILLNKSSSMKSSKNRAFNR
jgi:hypothetical protein